MKDSMTRIICSGLNLRAYAVETAGTAREIIGSHAPAPPAAVLLGRTVNAAALLAAGLKPGSDQNISVKFSGTGAVGEIHVQADARGNMRGYVSSAGIPGHVSGQIDYRGLLGAGVMTVTKNIGLKEPYRSVLPLRSGEVALELARYLAESEQVPSAAIIGFGLDRDGGVAASGGILIQTFPETETRVIEEIERRITRLSPPLVDAMKSGRDVLSVLSDIFGNERLDILDVTPILPRCRCGREFLREMLSGLGTSEIHGMIDEGGAQINCAFCGKSYHFTPEDLKNLL